MEGLGNVIQRLRLSVEFGPADARPIIRHHWGECCDLVKDRIPILDLLYGTRFHHNNRLTLVPILQIRSSHTNGSSVHLNHRNTWHFGGLLCRKRLKQKACRERSSAETFHNSFLRDCPRLCSDLSESARKSLRVGPSFWFRLDYRVSIPYFFKSFIWRRVDHAPNLASS